MYAYAYNAVCAYLIRNAFLAATAASPPPPPASPTAGCTEIMGLLHSSRTHTHAGILVEYNVCVYIMI